MAARTVILVDDDEAYVRTIARLLRLDGFEVTTHTSAASALNAMRHTRPDVILLDLVLRDEDGLSLAMRLRRHPATKGIPVIVTTGDVRRLPAIKGHLRALGCAVLTKPYAIEDLVLKLREVA